MLSQHVAKAKDIHVGDNKNKLMIVLHSSKMHSEGDKPQIIKIRSTVDCRQKNDAIFCLFILIQQYIHQRPKYVRDDEPFFIFRDREPVTALHFHNTLKKNFYQIEYGCILLFHKRISIW